MRRLKRWIISFLFYLTTNLAIFPLLMTTRCSVLLPSASRRTMCRPGPRHGLSVAVEMLVDGPQIQALDVLHGEEIMIITLAELKDLPDVVKGKLRGDPGFIDEHGDEVRVFGQV